MALINENFLKLPESYLFSDIKKKVEAFKHLHPDANIISLGIGDVTRPIAPVVIEALHAAVDEILNLCHIIGDTRNDGRWLQPVNIFKRKGLDFPVNIAAHFHADLLGGAAGINVAHHGAKGAQGGDSQHHCAVHQYFGDALSFNPVVHDVGHEGGLHQIRQRFQAQEKKSRGKHTDMPPDISQDQIHKAAFPMRHL